MTLHLSVKETPCKHCGTKKRAPSLNYLQTRLTHFKTLNTDVFPVAGSYNRKYVCIAGDFTCYDLNPSYIMTEHSGSESSPRWSAQVFHVFALYSRWNLRALLTDQKYAFKHVGVYKTITPPKYKMKNNYVTDDLPPHFLLIYRSFK